MQITNASQNIETAYDCPHCEIANSGFTEVFKSYKSLEMDDSYTTVYICHNCGMAIGAVCTLLGMGLSKIDLSRQDMVHEVYPKPLVDGAPLGTPDKVKKHFLNGCKLARDDDTADAASFSIRKSLEECVKEKGALEGNLSKKLKYLREQGLVSNEFEEWAHNIRLLGNLGVHEESSPDEARELVEFARAFFTYVYTIPSLIKKGKANNATTSLPG